MKERVFIYALERGIKNEIEHIKVWKSMSIRTKEEIAYANGYIDALEDILEIIKEG